MPDTYAATAGTTAPALRSYAAATSVAQGERLTFHLASESGTAAGSVEVSDVASGQVMLSTAVQLPSWQLSVPQEWPSALYRATFRPGAGPQSEVYFVVRSACPGRQSRVLVALPFATWQAYNQAGVPGEGLYWTEQPDRATRVSFDRPGGGPAPEMWEAGFLRWASDADFDVEYCSNLDLHDGSARVTNYQLLVFIGHDEYWSWEMRETVEEFARSGGNLAFLTGNTCWWQVRFDDELRTMVCYRDAVADPFASIDERRVTVEWSSAPVLRPENAMTGVGFRLGAGAWTDDPMELYKREAYVARFADHWVFDGTGVRDGDHFALGAVGYETDAADFIEIDGVPCVTGRDGTPASFVVLATSDLRHWRDFGQGGWATMGIFRLGAGTVFNAATINWVNRLEDPVVERITRNVIQRLAQRQPYDNWEPAGPAPDLVALTACEGWLFGVTASGELMARQPGPQNLPWRPIDDGVDVCCLASPREADVGLPFGLYAATSDGRLLYRDPLTTQMPWVLRGAVPAGTFALAMANGSVFAAAASGLYHLSGGDVGAGVAAWQRVDDIAGVHAMTAMNGRLFALANGRVVTRLPVTEDVGWDDAGQAGQATVLAAHAGLLFAATGSRLLWRGIAGAL